jgi:hypothetical protein
VFIEIEKRGFMSRLIKPIGFVLVLVALLFFLQSRVGEQPLTRQQVPVSQDALR